MMPSNKRLLLEMRCPHFYTRPSQARAVRERSGFVFPITDRVTRLVNHYQNFYKGGGGGKGG